MNKETLKELVKNILGEESEYKEFFKKALDKAGKSIPDMSDDEKKAFFTKIDNAWDGKGEKKNEGNTFGAERAKAIASGDDSFKVDGKAFKVTGVDAEDKENAEKFANESELPAATLPASIKAKLGMAVDKIKDSKLSYNQKVQVVGQVMDGLGIDKSEFTKMSSKLKGAMEASNEGNTFGAERAKAIAKGDDSFKVDGKAFKVTGVDAEDKENAEKFTNEEVKVGQMIKVVDNPHWEAALGKKGPFKRKVKMIDGDNVFFTDGSNSSMKYIKEEQSVNEEKYTVIDPKGNQMGASDKMQATSIAKKKGGEKAGYFVVSNKNALKARRALEKFKGDFTNPKLKDMMADLFYESVNEDYDGPAILKTGDKNALKVGEKITMNTGGKKKEYKVVKSNGNGDFVLHLVSESVEEANTISEPGEWVAYLSMTRGKKLLNTFNTARGAKQFLSKNVDKLLSGANVESVGIMSKKQWDEREAKYAIEGVNEAVDVKAGGYRLVSKPDEGVKLYYGGKVIATGFYDMDDWYFWMKHSNWKGSDMGFNNPKEIINYFRAKKITTESVNESLIANDGKILLNGKIVGYYDYDRGSAAFWTTDLSDTQFRGSQAFDTKEEMLAFFKKYISRAAKALEYKRKALAKFGIKYPADESVNEASSFNGYVSSTDGKTFTLYNSDKKKIKDVSFDDLQNKYMKTYIAPKLKDFRDNFDKNTSKGKYFQWWKGKLVNVQLSGIDESVNEAAKPTIKVVNKLKNEEGIQIVVTKTTDGDTMYGGFVVRGKLQKVIPVGANNSKEGVQKRALQIWDEFGKQLGESVNEGKFKVDDLVYNKRTKTVGIVRLGDDKYGEVKTDADGNVSVDELETYNPMKHKHQQNAKVAPSTEKEVNSRGLFNPFKMETVNEGNAFGMAVSAAKKEGLKEFEFNGKMYKVKTGSYEKNEAAKKPVVLSGFTLVPEKKK